MKSESREYLSEMYIKLVVNEYYNDASTEDMDLNEYFTWKKLYWDPEKKSFYKIAQ